MSFPSTVVKGVFNGATRMTTAIYEQFAGNDMAWDQEYQGYNYSHLRGPNERAGGRRDPTEEEKLEWDIQDAKQQLAQLNSKMERQEHQIRSHQASLPQMESRNTEVRHEIEIVNQDLAATRSHAPEEGTMLRGEVVREFLEMEQCVTDIINAFMEWCGGHIDRPLSRPRAREIRDHLQGKEDMRDSDKLVGLASGRNLWQLTELLLRRYLCLALEQVVFLPFLPGEMQGDSESEVLSEILATVRAEESQDRGGRWRALTYKQAKELRPRADTWCLEPATSLVNAMFELMTIITDTKLSGEALETAFQLTSRMFNVAAEFKDKAMMICTEADFEVYLRSSEDHFDPRFMEEAYKGRRSSKSIIIGVGLGLALIRSAQEGSRTTRRGYYPRLAFVIGDQSGFFA